MKNSMSFDTGSLMLLLTCVFIACKALGVFQLGWIWVFSPLWLYAIVLGVVLIVLFIAQKVMKRKGML